MCVPFDQQTKQKRYMYPRLHWTTRETAHSKLQLHLTRNSISARAAVPASFPLAKVTFVAPYCAFNSTNWNVLPARV